jgi:hypothetical protein
MDPTVDPSTFLREGSGLKPGHLNIHNTPGRQPVRRLSMPGSDPNRARLLIARNVHLEKTGN